MCSCVDRARSPNQNMLGNFSKSQEMHKNIPTARAWIAAARMDAICFLYRQLSSFETYKYSYNLIPL